MGALIAGVGLLVMIAMLTSCAGLAGGAKLNKVCKAMGYLLKDIMAFYVCVLAKHLR